MGGRELLVFQKAHNLVLKIYHLTRSFPKDEQYAITSQIRRAAASIAANIVEGNSRGSKKEYAQFLYTARGSLVEVKYFLLLAKDLRYLPLNDYQKLIIEIDEIGKMINGLLRYLKSN